MPGLNAILVQVTPFQQNCAVLWDETTKRGAVVDPGGEVGRILAAIEQHAVRVEKIILTHGHIDHAGGAASLREALGRRARPASGDEPSREIPIEGPDERDLFLLDGLEKQGRAYGIADARNVRPDRWLREGNQVTIADHAFAVLHCPGHTPGHLVLVDAAARFAIVGDVLFRGSVGRTDFVYGDHEALIDAIESKLLPLGDDVAFICGHGPGSTIGAERQTNPFLRR